GGVPSKEEDFGYDPTGNWLRYVDKQSGEVVLDQTRSSNKDNQITQIDGSSELIEYDRAGNAVKLPPGVGGDWSKYFQVVWDAWNRLVDVKDENGASVLKNTYDGLTRRIIKEASGIATHLYWNNKWKQVEEYLDDATDPARVYVWGERPG